LGEIEFVSMSSVILFPNPANDEIKIEIQNNEFDHISIYDAKGKLVSNKELEEYFKSYKLSTKNFSNGVYHLILDTKNGEKITKRFSIQH
jgi:hypothetical protein